MINRLNNGLRYLFFALIARVVVLFILGLNIRNKQRLPKKGPAILIANHNSHLDTIVLMTLLPLSLLPKVHPVAAMDYFLSNRWLAWFATKIIGILPIRRQRSESNQDPLDAISQSLNLGNILIFFPEGTRGEPEHMTRFKKGIAKLAERHPDVPVIPIYLHGLGKSLPKGEALLVPFFCDVFVGDSIPWTENTTSYMKQIEETMNNLAKEGNFKEW